MHLYIPMSKCIIISMHLEKTKMTCNLERGSRKYPMVLSLRWFSTGHGQIYIFREHAYHMFIKNELK
jgi:hypothetical protein